MSNIAGISSKLSLNTSEFSSGIARAEADANRLAKKLESQNKSFGLKGGDLQIAKLADRGISGDQIAKLTAFNDQLKATKQRAADAAAAQSKAASITQSMLTPLEKHNANHRELDGLLKSGLISQQTYSRAMKESLGSLSAADAAHAKYGRTLGTVVNAANQTGSAMLGVGKIALQAGALLGAAAAGGIALLTRSSLESIDALAKTADRIGANIEGLSRLHHAAGLAGVGNEQFDKSLQKMTLNLAEAAQGSGTAQAAIAELGLDAGKLASMTPDAAFREIAGAMEGTKSASDKARLAFALFGKEGVNLVNVLNMGKTGLDDAGAEADKLGVTINRIDAAKVEAANDAMTRAREVFTGAANVLAVQLSPFITAAAGKFVEMATSGEGMGKTVVAAFGWILTAVAKAADYLELAKAAFYTLQGVATLALLGIVGPLSLVLKGIEWLYNKISGSNSHFSDAFSNMADNLADAAKSSFDKAGESWNKFVDGTNEKGATQWIADVQAKADSSAAAIAKNAEATRGAAAATDDWAKKLQAAADAQKKIGDTLGDLQKQTDQFGMTESQKKLDDFSHIQGVKPEQVAQAKGLLDHLDVLEEAKKKADELQQSAKGLFDSTRSPLEKYGASISKLGELLNTGAIDWDLYGRGVRQAREELEKNADVKPPAPAAFSIAGSAEAQRLAFTLSHPTAARDDVAKRQLDTQLLMTKSLAVIATNTKPVQSSNWEIA